MGTNHDNKVQGAILLLVAYVCLLFSYHSPEALQGRRCSKRSLQQTRSCQGLQTRRNKPSHLGMKLEYLVSPTKWWGWLQC